MYRKILVANDGSEGGFKALTAAFNIATRYEAELHMVIVEEIPYVPGSIDEVEAERESADRRATPVIERTQKLAALKGIKLECHTLPGHPVPTIVEFVRSQGFDLLVTGFMGHSAIYNRLIGSKADRLVEHAPCSVLVVK